MYELKKEIISVCQLFTKQNKTDFHRNKTEIRYYYKIDLYLKIEFKIQD